MGKGLASSGGDLLGEVVGDSRRVRAKYLLPLVEYTGRYGCSERTIKGWIARGRKEGKPCPLDQPEELEAWYVSLHDQQMPSKVIAALASYLAETQAVDSPAPAAPTILAPSAGEPAPSSWPAHSSDREDETTRNLAEAVELLNRRWKEAEDARKRGEKGADTRASKLLQEWTMAEEKLRAARKTAISLRADDEQWAHRDDIAAVTVELHRAHKKTARLELIQSRVRLAAAIEDETSWENAIDSLLESIYAQLIEGGFREPLQLKS